MIYLLTGLNTSETNKLQTDLEKLQQHYLYGLFSGPEDMKNSWLEVIISHDGCTTSHLENSKNVKLKSKL